MIILILLWSAFSVAFSSEDAVSKYRYFLELSYPSSEYEGCVFFARASTHPYRTTYTLCSTDFDWKVANVVCRQLGFSEASEFGECPFYSPHYSTQFNCTGNETVIEQCAHSETERVTCNSSRAPRVKCRLSKETQQGFEIRLFGGAEKPDRHGTISVNKRRGWTPMCIASYDQNAEIVGDVVCRELGFTRAESMFRNASLGDYNSDELYLRIGWCRKQSLSLSQCNMGLSVGGATCKKEEAVGLTCSVRKVPSLDACSNLKITTTESWRDDYGRPVHAGFLQSPGYPNLFLYDESTECRCEVISQGSCATIVMFVHDRMFENNFNESIEIQGFKVPEQDGRPQQYLPNACDQTYKVNGATRIAGSKTFETRYVSLRFSSGGVRGTGKFRIQFRATEAVTMACRTSSSDQIELHSPLVVSSTPYTTEGLKREDSGISSGYVILSLLGGIPINATVTITIIILFNCIKKKCEERKKANHLHTYKYGDDRNHVVLENERKDQQHMDKPLTNERGMGRKRRDVTGHENLGMVDWIDVEENGTTSHTNKSTSHNKKTKVSNGHVNGHLAAPVIVLPGDHEDRQVKQNEAEYANQEMFGLRDGLSSPNMGIYETPAPHVALDTRVYDDLRN